MSTLEIIDVSTFEKQRENEKRKEKVSKKLDEKDMSNEVDKKYRKTHVENPFIHVKTQKSNEELEKSKQASAYLKTETLFEKYKKEKAKSELVTLECEKEMVKENLNYEVEISNFASTDTAQVANQNLTNLISSYYSNNVIKKQIFKDRLTNNPVVQRNNQRLIYNALTSLPLTLQFPLFIGLEILQTEDAYNQLVFTEQIKQQQQQKSKIEEVKE